MKGDKRSVKYFRPCPECGWKPFIKVMHIGGKAICYYSCSNCKRVRAIAGKTYSEAHRNWNDGRFLYSTKSRAEKYGCQYCLEAVDASAKHNESDDTTKHHCNFCLHEECPYKGRFIGFSSYEEFFEKNRVVINFPSEGNSDIYHLIFGGEQVGLGIRFVP